MDTAVSVVEAYLQSNGYFTVAEYPIVEHVKGGGFRAVTDIDILAVRLPGAGRVDPRRSTDAGDLLFAPDPQLVDEATDGVTDLIIGEAKEGRAELNSGARRRDTLLAALRRFAAIPDDRAEPIVDALLQRGVARLDDPRVQIRLIAFGSAEEPDARGRYQTILLGRCFEHMRSIVARAHDMGLGMHMKQPAMGLLALMAKAKSGKRAGENG